MHNFIDTMNITSSTLPSGMAMGSLLQNNPHKLEDLKRLYADAMVQEYNENRKAKPKIRVKSRHNNKRQNSLAKPVSLPQRSGHPFKSMKDVRIANINRLTSNDVNNIVLPEEPHPTSIRRELLFLRDIVNRRKEMVEVNVTRSVSQSQLSNFDRSSQPNIQPISPKRMPSQYQNALQGHSVRTMMVGWNKKIDEYEHYDNVVRDLLSEMKLRKSCEKKSSRPTISPSKYSQSKQRVECREQLSQCNFKSIIRLPKRDSMVFRMNDFGTDNIYQKKITSYIMFLYKVNFSNSIYVDLSLSSPGKVTKVKVGSGNNCVLIKSIVKRRFWLEIIPNSSAEEEVGFVWTQNTLDSMHSKQENCKRSEGVQSCERSQRLPKKVKKLKKFKKSGDTQEPNQKILSAGDIQDACSNFYTSKNGSYSIYNRYEPTLITNHIPHNYIIGSKKILFMLLFWYYQEIKKQDPFVILPLTYHIRSGETNNQPFKKFVQNQGKKPDGVWIVKPGQNTNRGNGINVASFHEVERLIRRRETHKNGEEKTYIIQKYLKPFLYSGRKFDIRHYLLITSVNGIMKAYWYRDGYIRTSSEKYDLEDLSNQFVHLTNDAIQKKSEYYGKYEAGNKVSYANFQRYLDQTYPHKKYSFQSQILQKMKQITTELIHASFSFLDPQRKNNNFELFGMDFMIDSKFKPYLIEVNANPCLEISCPLLQRIIPILTEHTFRLALDPLFPPPEHFSTIARYQLSDRILDKLKYELIFDEKHEGRALREIIDNSQVKFHLDPKHILEADEELFDNDGQEIKDLELD